MLKDNVAFVDRNYGLCFMTVKPSPTLNSLIPAIGASSSSRDDCRLFKRRVRRFECMTPVSSAICKTECNLLNLNCETFWKNKIDAENFYPRQLWRSIDALMGHGSVIECDSNNALKFYDFFKAEVVVNL